MKASENNVMAECCCSLLAEPTWLTHDLTNGDGLRHRGRGTASSDVHCHNSKINLLTHGEAAHHEALPLTEILVCHHPLSV